MIEIENTNINNGLTDIYYYYNTDKYTEEETSILVNSMADREVLICDITNINPSKLELNSHYKLSNNGTWLFKGESRITNDRYIFIRAKV
jgi:hypothetical protein